MIDSKSCALWAAACILVIGSASTIRANDLICLNAWPAYQRCLNGAEERLNAAEDWVQTSVENGTLTPIEAAYHIGAAISLYMSEVSFCSGQYFFATIGCAGGPDTPVYPKG